MTPGDAQPSPTVHVIHEMEVAQTALGQTGSQQILLGAPRDDQSPLLFGVTRVRAGRTTQLIEHDTAEVAYVIAGRGTLVTDRAEHAFVPGSALLIDPGCWHAIRADEVEVVMLFGFPCREVPPTRQWQDGKR